jgi:hypothetical protein
MVIVSSFNWYVEGQWLYNTITPSVGKSRNYTAASSPFNSIDGDMSMRDAYLRAGTGSSEALYTGNKSVAASAYGH